METKVWNAFPLHKKSSDLESLKAIIKNWSDVTCTFFFSSTQQNSLSTLI